MCSISKQTRYSARYICTNNTNTGFDRLNIHVPGPSLLWWYCTISIYAHCACAKEKGSVEFKDTPTMNLGPIFQSDYFCSRCVIKSWELARDGPGPKQWAPVDQLEVDVYVLSGTYVFVSLYILLAWQSSAQNIKIMHLSMTLPLPRPRAIQGNWQEFPLEVRWNWHGLLA